ncbi:uncharacterized protein LOC121530547 [Drosophila eugracilis]|uniref:uncharacterized protein LOC121530547 n=1 Tax=Drosophila eugracilis TaxID=29029 RepID=UPI001BDB5487|nr:uncharacterized protein LOC121530547 [Drosophila eugracilis]
MGDNKQTQTRPHPLPYTLTYDQPHPLIDGPRRNGMKKALAEVCLLVLESIVRNRRLLILPHSVALIGATPSRIKPYLELPSEYDYTQKTIKKKIVIARSDLIVQKYFNMPHCTCKRFDCHGNSKAFVGRSPLITHFWDGGNDNSTQTQNPTYQ